MNYKVRIWNNDTLKKELVYSADNDIQAIQMASAATPDNCRSTYEVITKEEALCMEKNPMEENQKEAV